MEIWNNIKNPYLVQGIKPHLRWKSGVVASRAQNMWKIFPLVPSKYTNWDNLVCLRLYIFWGEGVYFSIFEWWNSQLCQKNIIVNSIIQKLKSKHPSLKEYTNWDKLSCLRFYTFWGNEWKYFWHISGLDHWWHPS